MRILLMSRLSPRYSTLSPSFYFFLFPLFLTYSPVSLYPSSSSFPCLSLSLSPLSLSVFLFSCLAYYLYTFACALSQPVCLYLYFILFPFLLFFFSVSRTITSAIVLVSHCLSIHHFICPLSLSVTVCLITILSNCL